MNIHELSTPVSPLFRWFEKYFHVLNTHKDAADKYKHTFAINVWNEYITNK